MTCATCGHTMNDFGNHMGWCPRCGTIAIPSNPKGTSVPYLIDRCREFNRRVSRNGCELSIEDMPALLEEVGICESINLPESK